MHFHHEDRFNPVKIIPWIILGVLGAAGLALIFGLIVMALWNWLMPVIFGLPRISYWQGWGLVLLAHILFKGGIGHHERHPEKSHRDEWKQRFRERFTNPAPHGGKEEETDAE